MAGCKLVCSVNNATPGLILKKVEALYEKDLAIRIRFLRQPGKSPYNYFPPSSSAILISCLIAIANSIVKYGS